MQHRTFVAWITEQKKPPSTMKDNYTLNESVTNKTIAFKNSPNIHKQSLHTQIHGVHALKKSSAHTSLMITAILLR